MLADTLRTKPVLVFLALFLAAGGTAIATAWGFQIIGGYYPCKLCLEQRIPYYLSLPMASLALAGCVLAWPRLAVAILLVLSAGVMAYGAGLGVYQSGAEWGWWPGPSDCGSTATGPASVNDLMNQLQSIRIVSCTEASWRMMGLSFAGWNAVISAFLTLVALAGARSAMRAPEKP